MTHLPGAAAYGKVRPETGIPGYLATADSKNSHVYPATVRRLPPISCRSPNVRTAGLFEGGYSGTACDLSLTNPKQLVSDKKHEKGKHTLKPGTAPPHQRGQAAYAT